MVSTRDTPTGRMIVVASVETFPLTNRVMMTSCSPAKILAYGTANNLEKCRQWAGLLILGPNPCKLGGVRPGHEGPVELLLPLGSEEARRGDLGRIGRGSNRGGTCGSAARRPAGE